MWPLLGTLLLAAAPPAELRIAVVVGSNTAVEGRAELRYAHADAQGMAEVLVATGRFEKDAVTVLLDPAPAAVLAAVHAAAAHARDAHRPTLFVFYYSGHADDRALYPGGQPLELAKLKAGLEDPAFEVRVGIIDSCRGGGWTQAKGLSPTAPFDVPPPALASEGTALLAASSGQEDAHEAEALKGSFFTHHLVAGLRGAADQSGDGQVTLSEAFAYANRLTIRDSATRSSLPQHPSFDMRLHGRQDLVLADVGGSPTLLTVAQKEGPLQLVQLSTGVVVVEATAGEQVLRVALPPGGYLVRHVTEAGVRSREVQVVAGQATTVDEASLTLVGEPALAPKGPLVQSRHMVAGSFAVVPDAYAVSYSLEASYRFRFSQRFAVRVRGLYGVPVATDLTDQLTRDFGVLPTAITTTSFIAGADVEWLAWSGAKGAGAMTLGVSLGPSLVGLRQGGFLVPASTQSWGVPLPKLQLVPAATAGFTVALHLPSLPALAIFVDGSLHVGIALYSRLWVQPQINVGAAYHFL
jgi:hypothetical protein